MYDIQATEMAFEQCSPNKREINMLFPYAVIHFVLSGEGYLNGRKITANTAFIAYENSKMNYSPSKNDPWSYIYINLRGSELEQAFLDHGFSLGITVTTFSNTEALFQILSLYHNLSAIENPDAITIIANAALLLFKQKKDEQYKRSKPLQHVLEITQYIEKNYYKEITVEEIAAKFYLNKNYIRTIFVNHIGISPKQYLQKIRMERAASLLISTNENITLIANSVGYTDALLFSKMFKKYYDLSPTQYRKK